MSHSNNIELKDLLNAIEACDLCAKTLELGPRPIIQLDPAAKILIAGQAPGKKAHLSGRPFDDASGDRLRHWLGVTQEEFYNSENFAMLPMGFCFPGSGKRGDLAPRPECAPQWRERCLASLPNLKLTLVIGQYAIAYHIPNAKKTLTETVQQHKSAWTSVLPLPHPSPRNNIWMKQNPWFEETILPTLTTRVRSLLTGLD